MKCIYCQKRNNVNIYDARADLWFCEVGCLLDYRLGKK